MRLLVALAIVLSWAGPATAVEYWVDAGAQNASDENAGTREAPWKTISRAGTAQEIRPGDTVYIAGGVYREFAQIAVSGEEGRPVTFAAAPNARVVVKGSEIVRGNWERLSETPDTPEPFPGAFNGVWRIELGEEYFTDPQHQSFYDDPSKRFISQVFLNEETPLQQVGVDPIYLDASYPRLNTVGRGLGDLIEGSFFFDATQQALYLKVTGDPRWWTIETSVRGRVLSISGSDLVVRGLEIRHNREPNPQWPMVTVWGDCECVVIDQCRILQSDFCGLHLGGAKNCVVRDCDISSNGSTGIGMGQCEDCVVEDCRVMFNNYRRFRHQWHCGGMKIIPDNKRITVRHCEVAYTLQGPGIWFDAGNSDYRIIGNVSHHNGTVGIYSEINPAPGLIADNLVFANAGRGVWVSGSQGVTIAHNTVAGNASGGIQCMPRSDNRPLEDILVVNNVLIGNRVGGGTWADGADLILDMGAGDSWEPPARTNHTNHSDWNVFASNSWTPHIRHSWNPNNTLGQWQKRFGEDMHSTQMTVPHELSGTGFRLLSTQGLDSTGELPEGLPWAPEDPTRAGSSITRWPAGE